MLGGKQDVINYGKAKFISPTIGKTGKYISINNIPDAAMLERAVLESNLRTFYELNVDVSKMPPHNCTKYEINHRQRLQRSRTSPAPADIKNIIDNNQDDSFFVSNIDLDFVDAEAQEKLITLANKLKKFIVASNWRECSWEDVFATTKRVIPGFSGKYSCTCHAAFLKCITLRAHEALSYV